MEEDIRVRLKKKKEMEGYPVWDGHTYKELGTIYNLEESYDGQLYILGRVWREDWKYGLVSLQDGNGWTNGVEKGEDSRIMFSFAKPIKANGSYTLKIENGKIISMEKERN